MNRFLARTLLRAWPFSFGHVTLMNVIHPPPVQGELIISRLRRYDLLFRYNPNSYIGRYLYYRGLFEEQILRRLEAFLRAGTTFVDVGANIGLHSVVAAKLVGPTGRVVAIEPATLARQRLLENISLNGFRNVTVHACAAGAQDGTARLYSPDASNDGEATLAAVGNASESVTVRALDSLLGDVAGDCVMKLDIEGGEVEALRGAAAFMERVRPRAIFMECIDHHLVRMGSSSATLFSALHHIGYQVEALSNGRWIPVRTSMDCDLVAVPTR